MLRRIAINPSLRKSALAEELGITRSAVHQLWKQLEEQNKLCIGGILDYGTIGFRLVHGWAIDKAIPSGLVKLVRWLKKNPFVTTIYESQVTSTNDSRAFFEALLPDGMDFSEFQKMLNTFTKSPYNLQVVLKSTIEVGTHLNLGLFEAGRWHFDTGFKFEASLDGALPYADILPISNAIFQTPPVDTDVDSLVIISALERDYFATWRMVAERFQRLRLSMPSSRTIRRRLNEYRGSIVRPHLSIANIGLPKTILITLEEANTSRTYKLLRAQSVMFPKVRALSGTDSLSLIVNVPDDADWIAISSALSRTIGPQARICTFIAQETQFISSLDNISNYIVRRSEMKHDAV